MREAGRHALLALINHGQVRDLLSKHGRTTNPSKRRTELHMTTTPTTPADPTPGRYWLNVANDTADPYSMIGAAVTGLLAVLVDHDEAEGRAAADTAELEALEAELRQVEERSSLRQQVIDDILEAVKPSTSKLADKVRAIVDEAFKVAEVAPVVEPTPEVPAS